MKKIALIPILLGSTRIKDKNLIMVDGNPLVTYVVKACKAAGIFDEIYLNSEHKIFEKLAHILDVKFYHRKPERGGSSCQMINKSRQCNNDRCQTHDHFIYDFMNFLGEPSTLALVHTTSPLLEGKTIKSFMDTFLKNDYDSCFSVEEHYTETLYGEKPLNFSFSKKIPTQTLAPVRMISWALSAWKTKSFIDSYDRDEQSEHGPTFCGKVGYVPLGKIEALDGDTWDDLKLIEAALLYKRQRVKPGVFNFHDKILGIENDLESLIARDGVTVFKTRDKNVKLDNLEEIKSKMGKAPWLYLLVYSETDQTALICQPPGDGARKHCHITHDEWWFILEGAFEWQLEDGTSVKAKESDFVFMPKGTVHKISCTSKEPGIRLACGARDMEHIYVE